MLYVWLKCGKTGSQPSSAARCVAVPSKGVMTPRYSGSKAAEYAFVAKMTFLALTEPLEVQMKSNRLPVPAPAAPVSRSADSDQDSWILSARESQ